MMPSATFDTDPPSYQESFEAINISNHHTSSRTHSQIQTSHLHSRLTSTRTNHIESVITTPILPLIHRRATAGLSRTSIALVPSPNVQTLSASSDQDSKSGSLYVDDAVDLKSTTILGLVSHESDEDLQQVALTATMDTAQFWSQDAVVDELRRMLGERLAHEGLGAFEVRSKHEIDVAGDGLLQLSAPAPAIGRRGFFSRKSSSTVNRKVNGDRDTVPQDLVAIGRAKDSIDVDVKLDEICLRTQSAFGLYETLTKPALIVRVRIPG